jgi:arylsulfatase A-like enzyme
MKSSSVSVARNESKAGSDSKPNIIFLLTDDQRWDTMGCMGNRIIQTPNLDNMAENGVLFKNAFVTTAICCTSRASIFNGQYARRHGINDFSTDFSEEQLSKTYPMMLRDAGYKTGFVGKYGVGANLPADRFDYWRGIGGQPKYEHTDENGNYKHLTQIMEEQSIEFLQSCSQDQPFCLSVSFKAPHVQDGDPRQFIYDPAYKDLYKDAVIPVPKTADDKYFMAFPEFFTKDNEARRRWEIRFSTPEKYQESVKGYYRLITGVDVAVGRIRDELDRLNMSDNTIIMLLGDNGFYLGEHSMAGKWYGHEESIRVPLVVYDPRLPKDNRGQKREEMALNIDIAPTILSMVGLDIPDSMQGFDLMPLIRGEHPKWREEFLYEHLFTHPRIPKSEGVVTRQFKYLRYIEQDPVYQELYDLASDPYEENNLAGNENYSEILDNLRDRCDELCELYK